MKFGHLDDVNSIDFTLPPDHPVTAKVLKNKPVKKPHVYPGLAEWGNEGFPGKIYPKGTKAKDYLKLYGELFTVVELNATGYRIPGVKQVEGWVNAVPKGFKFCPKVSQPISQVKPLGKNRKALKQYFHVLETFGRFLGVAFLQLHPRFSPQRFDDLVNFFDLWDHTYPLHVELRHADWFSDEELLGRLFKEMKLRKIGTVITDTPGRRDVLHMALTTTTAFIRFEGNELHRTDFTRIDDWCHRLTEWIDHGLRTVYFFSHTTTKALTPEMSNHFIVNMNKLLDLRLKPAKIITPKDDKITI